MDMKQLFTSIAAKQANNVAVEDESRSLTYNDVLKRAESLARTIKEHPLEPEEPVGVVFGVGIELVIAQVALLLLGLTCIPLDPSLPGLRIQEMLHDVQARYVVTGTDLDDPDLTVIPLSLETPINHQIGQPNGEEQDFKASDMRRSHILYTSGSTGKPKPVQISPASLAHLATKSPVTPFQKTDRVALINNPGFDISLFEVWAALLSGATIVVVPRETVLDPFAFRDFIHDRQLSVVFLTSSLFAATALACPTAFRNVLEVLTAGEVASPSAMRTVLESGGPPARLWNTYGPTETTTFSSMQLVTPEEAKRHRIGIGKPVGDTSIFLLDEQLHAITSSGSPGEIFIGGPGLSPGYLGRPEENSRHFLEIPGHDLGVETPDVVRLYRTGDRACWRDHSARELDFLGRVDRQVKQGGFRIELEEVEQKLLSSDWFTSVVVTQLANPEQADPFLVAFVVSKTSGLPKRRVLEWASERMPQYMIPRDILFVPEFPLTANNKVDIKHLEQLYWERHEYSKRKADETTQDSALTAVVRELWASVLGVPKIDDGDDFFALGGSSIQSAKLISRLRGETGKTMSMRAFHENSRFEDFVTYLNEFAEGAVATHQCDKWKADSHLADEVPVTPQWASEDEGRVFMTGATGFVGVHFLSRLLRHPMVKKVVCLVRGRNNMSPTQRVEHAMERYNLLEETSKCIHKLTVLDGDIAEDNLGLSDDDFAWLSQWASAVFHLAARVNFCEPYEAHYEPNVVGTRNALRLAAAGRRKSFHFSSSIDAWGPTGLILGTRKCLEDDPLEPHLKGLPYDIGYAASKWTSEQMVRRARARGLPTIIYRPGFVIGDSRTGAGNPDDFFARLMVGSIKIGAFPHLPKQRMEYVTVDYVCDAILHISANNANLGRSFSLLAPDPADSVNLEKTVEVINDAGFPVQRVPYWDWVQRLQDPKNKDNPLMPLLPLVQEKVCGNLTRFETSRDTPHYDSTHTVEALTDAPNIKYIPFSSDQLRRFLAFWGSKGFYHV